MTTPENIKQVIEESDSNTLFKTLANRYIDNTEYILSIERKNRELVETVARENKFIMKNELIARRKVAIFKLSKLPEFKYDMISFSELPITLFIILN